MDQPAAAERRCSGDFTLRLQGDKPKPTTSPIPGANRAPAQDWTQLGEQSNKGASSLYHRPQVGPLLQAILPC